jgi:RHS repeat-associated protein
MTYAYDAMGRRISKAVQGGTPTQYLYDNLNAVQETVGTAVNPILNGPGVDERYARNDVTGRTYSLTDALGSTIALTDPTGAIREQYSYDPYGNTTQSDTTTGFTNPYQYTGREADTPGLYYYRARYCSPMMGGFISEDPYGFAGGQSSFYAYAGGDPLYYNDPFGLWIPPAIPQPLYNGLMGFVDTTSLGIGPLLRSEYGLADGGLTHVLGGIVVVRRRRLSQDYLRGKVRRNLHLAVEQ